MCVNNHVILIPTRFAELIISYSNSISKDGYRTHPFLGVNLLQPNRDFPESRTASSHTMSAMVDRWTDAGCEHKNEVQRVSVRHLVKSPATVFVLIRNRCCSQLDQATPGHLKIARA